MSGRCYGLSPKVLSAGGLLHDPLALRGLVVVFTQLKDLNEEHSSVVGFERQKFQFST